MCTESGCCSLTCNQCTEVDIEYVTMYTVWFQKELKYELFTARIIFVHK